MDRNLKIASLAAGAGLLTLPFGGVGYAVAAAVLGGLVGQNHFPAGEKPWRELEELLNEGEHGRLEFKESLCPNSKRKSAYEGIIKTIAAFANTDGGELIIGISDKGETVGLEKILEKIGSKDKFELALHDAIRSNLQDGITKLYRLKFDTHQGHLLCRIEVEKASGEAMFTRQGEFYKRNGCRSVAMTTAEYAKLQKKEDL